MIATYLPGELPTLLTEEGMVVAAADRLGEVIALQDRPLVAPVVIETLGRGTRTDLPDFAAVWLEHGEVRIMVRGAFLVRTDGFAVDGRDAATWAEATAPVPPGALIEIATLAAVAAGPELPLGSGVVRSAGISWRPIPAPEPAPAPEYTVVRAAAPAAPAPPPSAPPPSAPPPSTPPHGGPPPSVPPPSTPPSTWTPAPESADHDGRTITPAQLQALRSGQAASVVPPAPPAPPRPLIGLQLSTGRLVPVRRRVLLGRSPRIQQVGGSANLPALVTLDDPYVSSTHLEVAVEGGRVTATDTSTNGTLLTRPGRAPEPLTPGVATEVAVGDVLTLSKGLTATIVTAGEPAGQG